MTKTWKCSECGKKFFFLSELETHMIQHNPDKKFKCIHANCNKEFSYTWDYNEHLEEHKKPPKKCPHCDYTA